MKMGTILSPYPYDAAARHALQSVSLRRPAILHYASRLFCTGLRSTLTLEIVSNAMRSEEVLAFYRGP